MAVGQSLPRSDAPEKAAGAARYVDDLELPGCLHGATLRTTIAHGRIKSIAFDPDFPWGEFVVARAADIPGENRVLFIESDQPLLTEDKVLHPMQAILLVAHPRRERAYAALKHIRVCYEEDEPVLTIADSLARKRLLRGTDNVFKSYLIEHGDVEAGLAAAYRVVEGEYRLPHQEQAYLETQGMAAWVEKDGTLRAQGSLQCPYYVRKALAKMFPRHEVRVVQAATGGAFGGKEDYPSLLAGHAALLALKAGRPVKM
ncbi:MAG: molybdopterin-dependent oxidoreductase, partial [Elusimicrobia bacterium]|nr:molybdopterin-dependent oxidoreductase [Elusimicrobiota bacterium]